MSEASSSGLGGTRASARARRLRAAAGLFTLAFAACGGSGGSGPTEQTPPRLQPVTSTLTATVGALHPDPLQVRLAVPGGAAVAGATVQWVVSEGGGWVFPAASTTDASGVARTRWVAGPGAGQEVLAIHGGDTVRIAAQAAKTANRANSVHFDHFTPGSARAEAFRIEIEPKTDPPATFYEAVGFDGGYTGLQAGGDLGGKQVIFSVWDVNGVGAQLVDAAGSACDSFGGEGTGIKCRFLHPWVVGRRYRFEVQAVPAAATTDITAYFTDVTAGTTVKIATLRLAKVSAMNHNDVFVEDFGPESPSCLEAALRSVVVRDSEYRTGGVWQRFTTASFNHYHPRTVCANVSAASAEGGILLTTGGAVVGDPTAGNAFPLP